MWVRFGPTLLAWRWRKRAKSWGNVGASRSWKEQRKRFFPGASRKRHLLAKTFWTTVINLRYFKLLHLWQFCHSSQREQIFHLINERFRRWWWLVAHLCPTLAAPWTVARQAPLSRNFPQEYWIGLPFPSPADILPTQGSNSGLLHCRQTLYQLSHQWDKFLPKFD